MTMATAFVGEENGGGGSSFVADKMEKMMKYRLISRVVLVVAVVAMTVAGLALPSAHAFDSEEEYIASLGRICEQAWRDASSENRVLAPAPVGGIEYWQDGYPDGVLLAGTPGPDVLIGSTGSDNIRGEAGDDVICAGPGEDGVSGGDNNDHIFGNTGRDTLFGHFGQDILIGNADEDLLIGLEGQDKLCGGSGTDTYEGRTSGPVGDAPNEAWDPDFDSVVGTDVAPFHEGVECPVELDGPGIDFSGGIVDVLPDFNADPLEKLGDSPETVYVKSLGHECFELWSSGVEISVGRQKNGLNFWEEGYPGVNGEGDLEAFVHGGGPGVYDNTIMGDDYFTGSTIFTPKSDPRVYFIGSTGRDVVSGGNRNDILCGGPGNDELNGKQGNDRVYGGSGDDELEGKDGDDHLDGGNDFDKVWGGDGGDILCGGADDVDGELYGGGTSAGRDDHYEVNGGISKRGVDMPFRCPFNR